MKQFNLSNEVIASLECMNITLPTEIQIKTIPLALQGVDIIASSQTGSGKTLAYLLPIIDACTKTKSMSLVLVPTRELAIQVRDTLVKVTTKFKLTNVLLIGGEPISKQIFKLKVHPKIIIGTPGRIIDHLLRGTLSLRSMNMVVLDEMDRMLDMGMKEQLEVVHKYLPEKKQVLMFSATMPKHIVELSQKYLSNPQRIMVGSTTQAAVQVKQEMVRVFDRDKFTELVKQLKVREGSVIVFVNTKRGADQLAKMLKSADHKAEAIHGDLTQNKRGRVLSLFRSSQYRIMVATDVAARGLDIPHTQHVINYNLPMCPEDYLHRIGRTGRASVSGFALSFVSPEDSMKWEAIDRLMKYGKTTLRSTTSGYRGRQGGNHSYKESLRSATSGYRNRQESNHSYKESFKGNQRFKKPKRRSFSL